MMLKCDKFRSVGRLPLFSATPGLSRGFDKEDPIYRPKITHRTPGMLGTVFLQLGDLGEELSLFGMA